MSVSFWPTTRTASAWLEAGTKPQQPDLNTKNNNPYPTASITALDFLATLASPSLDISDPMRTGVHGYQQIHTAGRGGYAVVEVGTDGEGKIVAVKRSKVLEGIAPGRAFERRDDKLFWRHFEQLTLELRILRHARLHAHANIVTLLGICIGDVNGAMDLGLILEFSTLGSLRSCLLDMQEKGKGFSAAERLGMVFQIAQGLEALHAASVCHGDIKTENTLVFPCQGGRQWLVKISDFGQSIVPPFSGTRGPVRLPVGTPLLSAPELTKKGSPFSLRQAESLVIDDVLPSDVFSFGLLSWEVLKLGRRYFELAWLGDDDDGNNGMDTMVGFLNDLPVNGLLSYGLDFVGKLSELLGPEEADYLCYHGILLHELFQDPPPLAENLDLARSFIRPKVLSKTDVRQSLHPGIEPKSNVDDFDFFEGALPGWTSQTSFYDIRELSSSPGFSMRIVDDLPEELEFRILFELENLANRDISSHLRPEAAAMALSECHTLGFGGDYDSNKILHWLLEASLKGSHKASVWYHRVCEALGYQPDPRSECLLSHNLEQMLAGTETESYLLRRIHYCRNKEIEGMRKCLARAGISAISEISNLDVVEIELFTEMAVDELGPLHLAAWLGDNDALEKYLKQTASDAESYLGLNAAHYACLGGNLSTLRLLAKYGVPLTTPASYFHQVTPLHMAIFFEAEDMPAAIDILLEHGAEVDAQISGMLKLDHHDMRLWGAPITWATTARNMPMVLLLLGHLPSNSPHLWSAAQSAILHCYWEILEVILPSIVDLSPWHDDGDYGRFLWCVDTLRPFAHWIAHGEKHIEAIQKTVAVCVRHNLIQLEITEYWDARIHLLRNLIPACRTLEDFHLINALLEAAPRSYLKWDGYGMLAGAFEVVARRARSNHAWYHVLRKIADAYETVREMVDYPARLLHRATTIGSTIAVRVILEKGLDINTEKQTLYTLLNRWHPGARVRSSELLFMMVDEFGFDLTSDGGDYLKQAICATGRGDLIIDHPERFSGYADSFYVDILDSSLRAQYMPFPLPSVYDPDGILSVSRQENWQHFRYLVANAPFSKYLNSRHEGSGYVLLHKASAMLHLDSVRLLLDAGADAELPLIFAGLSLLPLQIACLQARRFFYSEEMGIMGSEDLVGFQRKSQAIEVAHEILQWHLARGNDHFRGITRLHLAGRMGIASNFSNLVREGYGAEVEGSWPGVGRDSTPSDLLWIPMEEDTQYEAVMECLSLGPEVEEVMPVVVMENLTEDEDDNDGGELER
ncbi:hypothetical protein QBC40DRAFT_255342 [Triangularia verruculosa]|uniref:Protein kinase domain-containing protein n=1 Tax=Triangularia verruculosa TaxID=2587418 RepID=A0AAN7AS84_9PEZI|nr:hypothetical protein QBC40DRAFT_255342 [Triangularia verruculosa]